MTQIACMYKHNINHQSNNYSFKQQTMKVLVTGASSGFGALTVKTLLNNGHEVAATMRNADSRNKEAADELSSLGAKIVELDVTSDSSVNAGVQDAINQLGGLDAVVNNAGLGVIGLQELFSIDDFKKVYEVNVFGVQRVIKAALPHLRAQGSGLLITVSSLLGRMNLPFYGPYNSTKWAVESIAESYRMELSALGIDSVVVEPGGFATSFFGSLVTPSDTEHEAAYGDLAKGPQQLAESFGAALEQNTEQNPQDVADAIAGLINTPAGERPFRTVVDKMGMGEPLKAYNEAIDQITEAIFTNFGMEGMLKLNTAEKVSA